MDMGGRTSNLSFIHSIPYWLLTTSASVMVRAQLLSELEEIIDYKKLADRPERQKTMRKTWMKRYAPSFSSSAIAFTLLRSLEGCQPDVEVWQRVLQVRTLVINPEVSRSSTPHSLMPLILSSVVGSRYVDKVCQPLSFFRADGVG
jgi:phosphatidylinositol kinase/protein kinase (PI-3  family)